MTAIGYVGVERQRGRETERGKERERNADW